MGSDDANVCDDERPVHDVTLSDYSIGETVVTQALWEAVMGNNPSDFKGEDRPVERISWDDAKEFIDKLNKLTGKQCRLPTEAEWEYAARGGQLKPQKNSKYSGSNDIDEVAWYDGNSGGKTHQVGTKKPNELGIYDMSGNVYEWCRNEIKNQQGEVIGYSSVLRGGSCAVNADFCKISFRSDFSLSIKYFNYGFRIVLDK